MMRTLVLSATSQDTDPCILLEFGGSRYMFNCGEGTSRLMLDTRVGFKATQAIFATRLAPEAIGGLTGSLDTP